MAVNLQHAAMVEKLPASFDGNPFLYATALSSLMSIACLALVVCGWMVRDAWRDRFTVHPKQILFGFRMMIAVIAFTSLIRTLPEVLYLQAYNDKDVAAETIQLFLTLKRLGDTWALPFVSSWMIILVAIYPHLVLVLKSGPARRVEVDPLSTWPRLGLPIGVFILICAISCLTAYAKVYVQ